MRSRPTLQRGVTLVELMIALTIGLLISAAMVFLFISSKQSFNTQEGMSQVQESGRNALRLLSRNIRYAGYLPNPLIDVDPTQKFLPPLDLPIYGTDGTPTVSLGISSARSDTASLSLAFYGNADFGVQTCLGDNANDDTNNPTLVNEVFYLTAPDANGLSTLNCWTRRIRNINSIQTTSGCTAALCATTAGQPIVEGVKDLQIRYGVDSDGDGVANQYFAATDISTNTQWRSVVSIEITLVLDSTNKVDGMTGNDSGRVSRSYSTTVAIRNRLLP